MEFKNESKCLFRGMKSLVSSKNGKPFNLVKIADTSTYETCDFFPEVPEDWQSLKENQEIKVSLISNGSYTSLRLLK